MLKYKIKKNIQYIKILKLEVTGDGIWHIPINKYNCVYFYDVRLTKIHKNFSVLDPCAFFFFKLLFLFFSKYFS